MSEYSLSLKASPVGKEQWCRDTPEWVEDCMKWRGQILTGKEAHWCYGWDGLPVDETTPEWPCECAVQIIKEVPKTDTPKLGCRRCGGWGRVARSDRSRITCDLCDGTGAEPSP